MGLSLAQAILKRLTAEGCLPTAHSTAEKINPSDLKGNLAHHSVYYRNRLDNLFTGMYWKDIVFTESMGGLENQAQKIAMTAELQEKHVKVTPQEQSELLSCCCRCHNLPSPSNGLSTLPLPYRIMSLDHRLSPLRCQVLMWLIWVTYPLSSFCSSRRHPTSYPVFHRWRLP